MAENLEMKKYLNGEGLQIFHGIIKGQWEADSTGKVNALETKLYGEAKELKTFGAVESKIGELNTALTNTTSTLTQAIADAKDAVKTELIGDAEELKTFGAVEDSLNTLTDTTIPGLTQAIETEKGLREQADTALSNRIDSLVAKGVDFNVISDAWKVNDVKSDDNHLSISTKAAWVKDGEIVFEDPNDPAAHTITYGTVSSNIGVVAEKVENSEKLQIYLTGNNGYKSTATEVDLSSLVLDNYINSITYHAAAEDGVEDVVAPYIKFTWATDDTVTGATERVLRISVADLVGAVEGTANEIDVTASNDALNDNTASNYKVSISQSFKDKIWGTEGNTALDNFTGVATKLAAIDAKDAAQDKALADYKTEQAAKDAAQDKALTDYKTEQAAKDAAQDKALEDYKTTQAAKDKAQDDRLTALEGTANTNGETVSDLVTRVTELERFRNEDTLSEADIKALLGLTESES